MKVRIIHPSEAPKPAKKPGSSSIILRRNSEYEYYFHKPMGKDFVTYHIHSNGELLLREQGVEEGDYLSSALYRELWESRYLYCKDRVCPELPSGPPKIPRAIRERFEKAKLELRLKRSAPTPKATVTQPTRDRWEFPAEPHQSKKQKRREQRAAERRGDRPTRS